MVFYEMNFFKNWWWVKVCFI